MSNKAHNQQRLQNLEALKKLESPTVLIAGGGINGIGLYRDLVLQGIDVLLVERQDFCSGASAALSRMIHGGLRYLEHGEFRLVRESLEERNALLRNAPHYVSPLATTIPIFDYTSGLLSALLQFAGLIDKPGKRGAIVIKLGLSFYDFLTRNRRETPTHSFLGGKATFQRFPDFHAGVKCSATYYDAQVSHPERLGLEMILDMDQQTSPHAALNYMSVAATDGDKVTLKDQISGEEYQVRPDIVVNATGAWIDLTNATLEEQAQAPVDRMVGGTKGSHLIIRNQALLEATAGQMVYYENQDGRICILFPYLGNVLVGSTDIKIDDPNDVRCEQDERDYILQSLAHVFPNIEIQAEEILYTFSGVRPLVHSDSATTGGISRDHICRTLPATPDRRFPVLCLIGGKWTTFRAFGEKVADQILDTLGKSRKQGTANLAIGGGKDYPRASEDFDKWLTDLATRTGFTNSRLRILVGRYGTSAEGLIEFMQAGDDKPLDRNPDYSQRELLHIIQNEHVVTLEDLLLRRTSLGITGSLSLALIDEVLALIAETWQWTEPQVSTARDQLLTQLSQRHAVTISSP